MGLDEQKEILEILEKLKNGQFVLVNPKILLEETLLNKEIGAIVKVFILIMSMIRINAKNEGKKEGDKIPLDLKMILKGFKESSYEVIKALADYPEIAKEIYVSKEVSDKFLNN